MIVCPHSPLSPSLMTLLPPLVLPIDPQRILTLKLFMVWNMSTFNQPTMNRFLTGGSIHRLVKNASVERSKRSFNIPVGTNVMDIFGNILFSLLKCIRESLFFNARPAVKSSNTVFSQRMVLREWTSTPRIAKAGNREILSNQSFRYDFELYPSNSISLTVLVGITKSEFETTIFCHFKWHPAPKDRWEYYRIYSQSYHLSTFPFERLIAQH